MSADSKPWRYPGTRIVVFARAPVAGQVKTRLQPQLGEAACLRLYKGLLDRTMHAVTAEALAPVQLWVDENQHHKMFLSYCNKESIHLQSTGNLGQKMAHAVATVLAQPGVSSVILLGSDCPELDVAHLNLALQALAEGEQAVITPAEDGGYVLLGLRSLLPAVFDNVNWGSEHVFEQTQERFAALGVKAKTLPRLWDVDRPEDLERLVNLDRERFAFALQSQRSGHLPDRG